MQGHGLAGRVALVTGGTDGIGKEIARGLAVRGARVIIVGSDPEKGRRAEAELRLDAGHASVEFE
jgi:NAD(P)-dependent dehydrogenase (short-subunit alcohol dehydrogenase family)